MDPSFRKLPASLEEKTTRVTLAGVPALVMHPNGQRPAPTLLWLHGRTAFKELDNGRYLRLLREGIASIAVDLPGHGERYEEGSHSPDQSPHVVAQMVSEIDSVMKAAHEEFPDLFDTDRLAIGGMSAGGMATLRRLCDPHPFVCAHIEGTTGLLSKLYLPTGDTRPAVLLPRHPPEVIEKIDASAHLDTWRPIPLQALHTKGDRLIPYDLQERFLAMLGDHYEQQGASRDLLTLIAYEDTGAPDEHAGFGRFGNDSKNTMTSYLKRAIGNGQ